MADQSGGQAQQPVAQRVRLGVLKVRAVVQAEQPAPGGQVGGLFAASTHPEFTSQVFDGKLRRPIDFAVRTPSSTTACWRCSTSMNWAWWLPGTPPIPRYPGKIVLAGFFDEDWRLQ